MKDEEKAKEMFFDYACNTFFMAHDGVYEQYRAFGIKDVQEAEWRREYISSWVNRLSVDDLTAVDKLRAAWADEALPDLMEWADKGDSYAKLWYANAIWHLAHGASISEEMRTRAIKTAMSLWQSLLQGPVVVSNNHKTEIAPYMEYLGASTPETYVLNYAKRQMAESTTKRS